MSKNTRNSSSESSKSRNKLNIFFQNILFCKCGKFHEFEINFKKEHFIVFPCVSIQLVELNKTKDAHKKCDSCTQEISFDNGYCNIQRSKTLFFCEKCYKDKKYNNFNLNKKSFATISSIIFDNNNNNIKDNFREKLGNKFQNFIDKNTISDKNEFYNKNLSAIKLLQNFIEYLFHLRKLYNKENAIYQIITNFLEYSEHLIDIALNNIKVYDLYHFNKETVICSYSIERDKMLSYIDFELRYVNLLNNCEKQKYLSQEILKYICNKYKENNAINQNGIMHIERKYLKKIKINIKNEVFSKASAPSLNYLTILSGFSEIKNELEMIELKTGLKKLNEEIF